MNKTSLTSQLNRLDTDRLKAYRELLDFYHGRQWSGRERRGEKRLTFNYSKVFIDKITSYLMSGISFVVEAVEDSAEAKKKAQRAEDALNQVYEENDLEQLDLETEIDCAIMGDASYKVSWDGEAKRVRVSSPDVQGLYAWWLGDDITRVWRIASRYQLSAEESELLYKLKPKGKQATVVELWTEAEFELYLDDALIEKKPNPYGFIPFVIYPNLREPKRFWGISDLTQIIESQRELNRAMSQLSRILELSGNPIAVLENVEESEDITVRPGAVWNIPEDAKAYLLDLLHGGGVGLHIDYINVLYRILHDISESPRAAFGGTERDLSGVALEIELNPLLQKVRRKRIIRAAFMDKPDVYRAFFIEKFNGNQAYQRPFWSHSVPGSKFIDNLWHEPVPFNLESLYGLAIAHHGDYAWLSAPDGVWRARLTEETLDLSADVLSLKEELALREGELSVELTNDGGRYSAPGAGDIAVLDIGGQLDFSPGYVTSQGNETSSGPTFIVEAYEHISAGGKASLVLHAYDGWRLIENWRARHQFRWNQQADEMKVKEMLAFVLGRVGLRLEVESASEALTDDYPDFAINPGNRGDDVIKRLLSLVPDVLFIEGDTAYVVNPLSNDASDYSYGSAHPVFEGRYQAEAVKLNRLQVEGYDPAQDEPIVVDSFAWEDIERLYDRLGRVEDRNIDSATGAEDRGESYLRDAAMAAANGAILVPANCGQQLYDVIDITDSRAGLAAAKRRVIGLTLFYSPQRGDYHQRLLLGRV